MAGRIDQRLKDLKIALPATPLPAGNYVPYVITGNLVFISGQISIQGDDRYLGKLGDAHSVDDGQKAARICALNILAQLNAACDGDLDRVVRCVRLGGFVNCTPEFSDQPRVINGASDLIAAVFGDSGKHSRAAIGAPSLPLGVAVEIDAIFEIA